MSEYLRIVGAVFGVIIGLLAIALIVAFVKLLIANHERSKEEARADRMERSREYKEQENNQLSGQIRTLTTANVDLKNQVTALEEKLRQIGGVALNLGSIENVDENYGRLKDAKRILANVLKSYEE